MIDIHSHILPQIDDGSPSMEVSLDMLKKEEDIGVDTVILTPHYRGTKYRATAAEIKEKFSELAVRAKEEGINVTLKYGQEIFVSEVVYDKLKSGELLTIEGTNAVLLEFPYGVETDVAETAYNFKVLGYTPIIAHVERYSYVKDIDTVAEIKANGGLIQVNASSVVDSTNKRTQKFIFSLIKAGLVDFIAGDYHSNRELYMKSAYELVEKKFNVEVAENLFSNKAKKILNL